MRGETKPVYGQTWLLYVLSFASVVSDSLRPYGLQPIRLFCPCGSPDKNTGVGCCTIFQGIFLTQGSNSDLLGLLHWQTGFLPVVPPRKPGLGYWEGSKLNSSILGSQSRKVNGSCQQETGTQLMFKKVPKNAIVAQKGSRGKMVRNVDSVHKYLGSITYQLFDRQII